MCSWHGPQLVAVEATGGFETVAVAALAAAGLPLVVVDPAQVPHSEASRLSRRQSLSYVVSGPWCLSLETDNIAQARQTPPSLPRLQGRTPCEPSVLAVCSHEQILTSIALPFQRRESDGLGLCNRGRIAICALST